MKPSILVRPLLALGIASLAAYGYVACAPAAPAPAAAMAHENDPILQVPATMQGDRFAFDLFRQLIGSQAGNVTFSPASLEALLQLLREGTAGSTRAELAALRMGQRDIASAMQVSSADALFAADDLKLKPGMPVTVQRAPFASTPAQAVKTINDWCAGQTQGLIPSLVSEGSVTSETRLVLLNAIHLHEKWLRPFNKDATSTQVPFYKADGATVPCTLMFCMEDFHYAEGEDWQAVALFYRRNGREGEPGCFIGILPKGNARDFARKLTARKFDLIRRALATSALQEVGVYLPKMGARQRCRLAQVRPHAAGRPQPV